MRILEEYSGTSSTLGMALEHFGRVEFPPEGSISHHTHNHYEFCLIESGIARYWVDDSVYEMSPGDLVITRPGEFHGMSGGPGEHWTLAFINVRQMPDDELEGVFSSTRVKVLPGCTEVRPLVDDLLTEARGGGFGSLLAVHALTARFLVDIARRLQVAVPNSLTLPYSRSVAMAMEYIGSSGTYNTSVGQVAYHAGISESRLSHVFKEETGQTVREYLRTVLMQRARRMLEEGSFTVTEMADRLGFPSVACFSAFFRSRQGAPPTTYKRRASQG